MKPLVLLCVLLVVLAVFSAPAKADCPSWTTTVATGNYFCGYDQNMVFFCAPVVNCVNPDGTIFAYGDTWYNLAQSYIGAYGSSPDVDQLEQYYLQIC